MKQRFVAEEQIAAIPDSAVQPRQQLATVLLPNAVKITIALFSADFISMLFMNILRLPSHFLPWVFLASFGSMILVVYYHSGLPGHSYEILPTAEISRLVWGVLLLSLIYSCVRFSYALEMPLHRLASFSTFDDQWHVQEINSLANSARYPAQSSFDLATYFSMYYAPWMLAAAIYRAISIPGFTIKTSLFLCCSVYLFLIPLALTDIALRLARTRSHFYWAFYWIVCWTGMEGLVGIVHPLQYNHWWMRGFGLEMQFSNYSTLSVFVIHHLTAATALIVAWYLWSTQPESRMKFTVLACSLLAAYAFYSSVFVCLGALPIALVTLLGSRGAHAGVAARICAVFSALIAPLFWLYLRKPGAIHFLIPMEHPRWVHIPRWLHLGLNDVQLGFWSGFAVFTVLLILSFPFLPWAIVANSDQRSRFSGMDKALIAISTMFLITTYFVGFPLNNNYAMRGAIIPIIVLAWICSRVIPPIKLSATAIILLVIGSFGTLQEIVFSYEREILAIAKPSGHSTNADKILSLNRDRSFDRINRLELSEDLGEDSSIMYHVEKLPSAVVRPWIPNEGDWLERNRQLENRGPCGLWKWQRNPDIESGSCSR